RPADAVAIYEKGGWAFWMLMRHMGRDAFLAGMRDYFDRYHERYVESDVDTIEPFDHPVLEDFFAVMRPHAADASAFDAFVEQWFQSTGLPEYRLTDGVVSARGDRWQVTATLTNWGVGRPPVEVAATFDEESEAPAGCAAEVVAGPDESVTVSLVCDTEPSGLVVDPGVHVLQLQRRAARWQR
ncbi:MAG: hypothetical protein AAGE94_01690, partial [Acidobacteriota bacterium]